MGDVGYYMYYICTNYQLDQEFCVYICVPLVLKYSIGWNINNSILKLNSRQDALLLSA